MRPSPLGPGCTRARPVTTPPPEYPADARRNDVEGTVMLELVVLEDGRPSRIRPLNGPVRLVDSAMRAVEGWTFEPARCEGRLVPSLTHVRMPFRLRDASEAR